MLQAGQHLLTATAAATLVRVTTQATEEVRPLPAIRVVRQEVSHLQVVSLPAIHFLLRAAHVPEAEASAVEVEVAPVPVAEAVAVATPAAAVVAEEGNSFVSFLYYKILQP